MIEGLLARKRTEMAVLDQTTWLQFEDHALILIFVFLPFSFPDNGAHPEEQLLTQGNLGGLFRNYFKNFKAPKCDKYLYDKTISEFDKMDNGEYFDKNVNIYGNAELLNFDKYFFTFIKKYCGKDLSSLLDIGGGSGIFSYLVAKECPNIIVTLLDPSKKMLAKMEDMEGIIKVVGKLPNEINLNSIYNYIHIKEVFHHITGPSIKESKNNLEKSLQNIKMLMNNNSYLLIHELFFESPIILTLSNTIIFYLLKLQNKIGFKIPIEDFVLGLNVYFYTRKDFRNILHECGFEIIDFQEELWKTNFKLRLIFVKFSGRMVFICRKMR